MRRCELIDLYSFFGKKWSFPVFSNINENPITYNQLYKLSNHLINPTLLSNRLKKMIEFGIVKRSKVGGKVSYTLTVEGVKLKKIFKDFKDWADECSYEMPEKCKGQECVCDEVFVVQ